MENFKVTKLFSSLNLDKFFLFYRHHQYMLSVLVLLTKIHIWRGSKYTKGKALNLIQTFIGFYQIIHRTPSIYQTSMTFQF